MTTIGHSAALKALGKAWPGDPDKAIAVAMVSVAETTLWCGPKGLEKGVTYLLALFGDRLVLLHPTRRPNEAGMVAEFARKTYRITDTGTDRFNLRFTLSRPYGRIELRMSRWASYKINHSVLEALTKSAASAEKLARSSGDGPLLTAGEKRAFARMCAAYGPGAEAALAVGEVQVLDSATKRGLLAGRPELLLGVFPDRVVLLDRNATLHLASTPVAQFPRGAFSATVLEDAKKHVDLTLAAAEPTTVSPTTTVRLTRYGDERVDGLILTALLDAARA
ncbi:MAG: hypothetical protein ACT4P1_02735 [Sporichthyaceae bacterium]